MLIDTHTHVFPPYIAEKAICSMVGLLEANLEHYGVRVTPRAGGTAEELIASMDACGCTHSVLCPVVTNEKSTQKTNGYAMSLSSDRLIPFAGLMPSSDNYEALLEDIAARGFKGIKLHPEYQCFDIDGERCIDIVRRAEALGLAVLFHAGHDPGYPPSTHASPRRIANLLEKVNGTRVIAAHMGGWLEWENVEKHLIDSPVYFDTANTSGYIDGEYCKHLMRAHGTDKILFASDFPWHTAEETLAFINSLGLTESEKDEICFKNAKKLLFDN